MSLTFYYSEETGVGTQSHDGSNYDGNMMEHLTAMLIGPKPNKDEQQSINRKVFECTTKSSSVLGERGKRNLHIFDSVVTWQRSASKTTHTRTQVHFKNKKVKGRQTVKQERKW